MARINVVATEHPVPLPDGRFVRTAAEDPDGVELELDLFVRRRMDAGELAELPPSEPAKDPVPVKAPDPKPTKPTKPTVAKES